MNKLEDDPTYQLLQSRLDSARKSRDAIDEAIEAIMRHINAIKRDFKQYEEEYDQ